MMLLLLHLLWIHIVCGERSLAFMTNQPFGNRNDQRLLKHGHHKLSAHEEDRSSGTNCLPDHLINALDLTPLLQRVSNHAGTRRGREALLALVKQDQVLPTTTLSKEKTFSRRDRAMLASTPQQGPGSYPSRAGGRSKSTASKNLAPIASSAVEARNEFEFIEEALTALMNETYPPYYAVDSSPWDTETLIYTDDDEWLDMPAEYWTLENLIQAEQVLRTLIGVKEWASQTETQTWLPGLSTIGRQIDDEEDLPILNAELSGNIEIIRVRTVADPGAKSSYSFRINEGNFPILKILRDKEAMLLKKGGKSMDRDIVSIQEEIEEVEFQIRTGLAQSILGKSDILNHGLDCIARLDTLFARAAFGAGLNGLVPKISDEGVISVSEFLHPVLASNDGFSLNARKGEVGEVVPVDLGLCSEAGKRALIISGPNGGGKTLSMKSFGIVSVMARLGIPITLSENNNKQRPRVDYFGDVLVDVGDQQNVLAGESTWTSKLNSWASIISKLDAEASSSDASNQFASTGGDRLVLLDELGSGTDPEAGGAVAQAILEELMAFPTCHIVATTHSPRLKSLSYQSSDFNCATMLLDGNDNDGSRRPSFRLAYCLIGESHAMVAASRCSPALPESVLSRASELMSEVSNDDDDDDEGDNNIGSRSNYISALTSSMEEQVDLATKDRQAAEQAAIASAQCRNAMLILATSYESHLARLEQRVEDCYEKLKQETENDLELTGQTLAELRVVIKQVQSQQELLREKGLKLIPSTYTLQAGESVVVLATGQWEGATVSVLATSQSDDRLSPTEILVKPSTSLLPWDDMFDANADIGVVDMMMDRPIIVQRHELAIWDYDSVWDYEDNMIDSPATATSVSDSKRRLNTVLSTLKTESSSSSLTKKSSTTTTSSFTSSRERKASKNKKGKKKKKKNTPRINLN